ncbi:MAG: hypothetical protein QXX20_08160 [Candidatus Thermoplasmatota archaeon]
MVPKKTIIVSSILSMILVGAVLPSCAQNLYQKSLSIQEQEALAFEKCILCIEQAAQDAQSYSEFIQNLNKICSQDDFSKYPVIKEFLKKLLIWMVRHNHLVIAGRELDTIFTKDNRCQRTNANYFVISHGSYSRLRPQKENEVKLSKHGFVFWRYSEKTPLIHGKTVIIEKNPFELKKRLVGEQLGFMIGFKGIFLDIESRLTGKSYMFFMGRAQRVRAVDLTPFSK